MRRSNQLDERHRNLDERIEITRWELRELLNNRSQQPNASTSQIRYELLAFSGESYQQFLGNLMDYCVATNMTKQNFKYDVKQSIEGPISGWVGVNSGPSSKHLRFSNEFY